MNTMKPLRKGVSIDLAQLKSAVAPHVGNTAKDRAALLVKLKANPALRDLAMHALIVWSASQVSLRDRTPH